MLLSTILCAIFGKKENVNSKESSFGYCSYEPPLVQNTYSEDWACVYQDSLERGYDKQEACFRANILSYTPSLTLEDCTSIAKNMKCLCFHIDSDKISLYHHFNPQEFEILGTVSLETALDMHSNKTLWIEIESLSRHILEAYDLM